MRLIIKFNKYLDRWHIKNERVKECFPDIPDCDNTNLLFPLLRKNKARKYIFIATPCNDNWKPLWTIEYIMQRIKICTTKK